MASTKITINKGTTYTITGTYKESGVAADITGATIYFTAKSAEYDTDTDDSDALIATTGTLISPTEGTYTISLTPALTDKTPGNYYYDIKIKKSGGQVYKLVEGRLVIDGSPTNRATA